MPLRIFRSRALSTANLVVFALGASMFAMWYLVSLYLQQVLGYSPLKAGLAFLPMPATIVLGTAFASRAAHRFGVKPLLVAGMTLIGVGMLLFSGVSAAGSYTTDVLAAGLVTALGLGLSFVPVTIAAVAGVPQHEAGLASGLINTSRQMGGALGLAVLATIASERTHALVGGGRPSGTALTAGFDRAFVVGAGFALAGAVVALVGLQVRGRREPAAAPVAERAG
jgi:predicted MFS family arabinose efflux permease